MDATDPVPAPRTYVVYGLIVANLIAFAIEVATGANLLAPTPAQVMAVGGNAPALTLHGEPWRLVTATFLHYGLLHLAMNMVCLWQGRVVELLFGRAGFAVIYAVAGVMGSIASLAHGPETVAAGASGAVFGVYGAFGGFLLVRRGAMADELWSRTARQLGTFLALNLMIGLSVPGVDMAAHAAGAVAGGVAGALLLVGKRAAAQRAARLVAIGAVGAAIAAAALVVVPRYDDVGPALDEFAQVEAQCLARLEQLSKQVDAGTLSDAAFADGLERDVLGPWRAVRARLDGLTDPPPRLVGLMTATRGYLAARQAAWEALVDVARKPPPDDDRARLDEITRLTKAADAAAQAVRDEIQRMQAR